MKKIILSLILFLIYFYSINTAYAQWQQTNGPSSGVIECMAVSGTNIFVGTCGGVFLSSNNGSTWTVKNNGLTNFYVKSLAVSGTNIFAGTIGGGVFLSSNNGNTWTAINTGLSNPNIFSLAVSGTNIFAGTPAGKVFLSTTNGSSWTAVNNGLPNCIINNLTIIGTNIFAGTDGGGVFLSSNNGNSWFAVNNGLTNLYINSLAVSGTNIFAGTQYNLFRSSDNGNTWTVINSGITANFIYSIAVSGINIFAGTRDGGVFLSTNNGNTWTSVNDGLTNYRIMSLVVYGTIIFAGTDGGGVFKSSNNGNSWMAVNNGLINSKIATIAVCGTNIFASTSYGGVFLSSNDGSTWIAVNNGLAYKCIWNLAVSGTNIFAGTYDSGVFLSTNNGSSWSAVNNGLTDLNIYSLAVSGTNIYAGTQGGGMFLSTNNGSTWTAVNNGLTCSTVGSIAFSGINIFAGTNSGGVFLSTNNGNTWTAVNNGLTSLNVPSLAVCGTNIFAGTMGGGVFKSTDNGSSWTAVNNGLTNINIWSLAVCGTNIFAGTYGGGVFKSNNLGSSWTTVNTGLINKDIHSLVIRGTDIYAGTYDGVWKRPICEMINCSIQITYPKITLNASNINAGQNIIINGSNFTTNGTSTITLQGPGGFLQNFNNIATSSQGIFIYNYATTTAMPLGNYTVSAKDNISGLTTITKSFALNAVNSVSFLEIVDPIASFSINANQSTKLEFKDKMVIGSGYTVSGSERLYSYSIQLSVDGGSTWGNPTTITGQELINHYILKQYFFSIPTTGSNYKYKITDNYHPSYFVTTPVFTVNTSIVTGNLNVQLKWDYSYPMITTPINGICADGTARIYLKLAKTNTGIGSPISSVSVTLDDGGVNTGFAKLGKVMVATNTSTYSSEANGINTLTATNNTPYLSDYYFWYVAPNDFVGNATTDQSSSSRVVNAIFTVTYSNATVETIINPITIVRAPLMLVHGLGGDPSTWDNFRENLTGNTYNFINDNKFKTAVAIKIDPIASFASNALNISVPGDIDNSIPGVIKIMRSRGYASIKVDYIGHSMGGSVLRYVLDHDYDIFTRTGSYSSLKYKNYEAGFVNKVITIGTPHRGSPLANIINRYVGDINPWQSGVLMGWYAWSEKPFPFYFIKEIDPSDFIWEYKATDAVMDLRIGGVSFNASNVKAHLIAGDIFPGEQLNLPGGLIPQETIDAVHNSGDNTLEHFVNYLFQAAKINETDPILHQAVQNAISNIEPVSDALSFIENLTIAMDAFNIGTFIPESDIVVGVGSQDAGFSRSATNVTIIDNVAHSSPLPNKEVNNLQIGNTVMQLLNDPISSNKFAGFPDNTINRQATRQFQKLISTNPFYSIRDTNMLKIVQPNYSDIISVDSNMNVHIKLLQTVGLETLNIYFQGKTYPIHDFSINDIIINLQVNSNILNWNKLYVEGYYNYIDSAKLVYDERTVDVFPNDSLIGFTAAPDLMQLAINQISFADYTAQHVHFNSLIATNDQNISLTINDTNIVFIDNATKGFKGKHKGQTFAVATYIGISDTIYFNVSGCTGSTVHILPPTTYLCIGDTLILTADNGTHFDWSTGDTTQIVKVFTGGDYTVIAVDSNSCLASATVSITQPSSPPTLPIVTSPVYYCQSDVASSLMAAGSYLQWYTVPTGGIGSSTAPTPSTITAGTTHYYVSQTVSGCESPRTDIAVNVTATPSSPSATTSYTYCQNTTTTQLTATGAGLQWYTVPTGGIGSSTAPTPSTITVGTTHYYVSQTVSSCESPRTDIAVNVTATTSSPSATTSYTYCQNTTTTQLTATGAGLQWYTVPTGGIGSSTAPTPSTITVGTTHYYVSQTVSGCESPRTDIAVNVTATPSSPSATTSYTYCQNTTTTQLTATGAGLQWYTVPTGGIGSSTAPTPSTITVGTTHYYVSQTVSGCESPRTDIAVNVTATPSSPSATTSYTYCQNTTTTQLTATGAGLQWYTVPTGGIGSSTAPTPSTITAGTTHYYVSQTVSSCESPRTDIAVNVTATPSSPSATTSFTYCQNTPTTQLTATGAGLQWYTVPTGGIGSSTAPTPSTITVGTTHYYVSQTVSGCESPRTDIAVNVTATPSSPSATTSYTYCQNTTTTQLTATGAGLQWYTVPTGGIGSSTAPTPSTITAGTTHYYVSQTVSGCESPRTDIAVNVTATPSSPSATTSYTYCQNTTTTQLTATGAGLQWYTVPTGGIGSSTAPTPSTITAGTTHYYVSQTVSGCESPRTDIAVNVTATPSSPSATTSFTYCQNTTTTQLTATGAGLQWYTVPTGGIGSSTAPTPSTITAGTTHYYVSQAVSGCESPRTDIAVNVTATPSSPSATTSYTYCQNTPTTQLTATGAGLQWYTVPTGGIGSSTAPTPSTITAGTTHYYVSQTVSGCESPRTDIAVNVTATPSSPSATTSYTYCQNTTTTQLTATGAGLQWYTVPTGGIGSSTAPTPSTITVGTTHYYVSQTVSGCESPRTDIAVNVFQTPVPPIITINSLILHSNYAIGNQWYNQNGLISGDTTQDYSPLIEGDFYVIVTQNGCSSSASNIINVIFTGIKVTDNNNIKVYPNPFTNEIIIEIIGSKVPQGFEIFNSIGKIVSKGNVLEKAIVKTTDFSSGIYMIKFDSGKQVIFKKIIKQ